MKNFKASAAVAVSVLVFAISAQVPTVEVGNYTGVGANNLSFNEQAKITGDKNFYYLNFLQSKPDKYGQKTTFINLSAPREYWNFGRAPINFLSLKVNRISLREIEPQPKCVNAWTKGDRAGAEFVLNFDGAKIILNASMKKGSPLLFLSFTQPVKQLEPIKSKVQIEFGVVISRLLTKNKTTIWEGVYGRQALTASRELKQRKAPFQLNRQDKYLIFSDSILDGTGKGDEKGVGPCLLVFDLENGMAGTLKMQNRWHSSIVFFLPPDFKEFRCAIFMQKNKISNADFMKRFEAEKESFTNLD